MVPMKFASFELGECEPGGGRPSALGCEPQQAVHAPLAAYFGLRCGQHMDTTSKNWLFGRID